MPRLVFALIVATAASSVAAGSRTAPLRDAFERGDAVAFDRAARTSSAAAMRTLLESGERRAILTAALAAPAVDDAPLLLPALARAAHSPDRSVALACARAGLDIARATDAVRLADLEVPRVDIGDALRTWHALARDDSRWADVRVVALDISAQLAAILADKPAAPVIELTTDGDPEVRLAAFELLPTPLPAAHAARVGSAVASEQTPRVALAAAVALCGGIAHGDKLDVARALGDRGKAALIRLLDVNALPLSMRVTAALCLRPLGATDALAAFTKNLPRDLAKRLDPVEGR